VLPESLPKERREPFTWARANPVASLHRLFTLKGVGGTSLGGLVVAQGLGVLAQFVLHSSWVLYAHFRFAWDVKMVAASLVVVGIAAVVAQGFLIKPLVARFGRRQVALASMVSSALAYLAYGLSTAGWLMFAIIALNLLAHASAPALNSIISEAAEPSEQGRVMGSLSSVSSLMGVLAPLIASPLLVYIAHLQPGDFMAGAPFFAAFAIQCSAIGLLLWSFSKK
jgi:MFS transporter, DHA1 family, tetracycline resistance protein